LERVVEEGELALAHSLAALGEVDGPPAAGQPIEHERLVGRPALEAVGRRGNAGQPQLLEELLDLPFFS
jgi:hypothetical protein